jgi:hypothetical protein
MVRRPATGRFLFRGQPIVIPLRMLVRDARSLLTLLPMKTQRSLALLATFIATLAQVSAAM